MTLTETIFWTKILSKYVGGGFLLVVIGYFVYIGIFITNENKIISPDYACGMIVAPEIIVQDGVKMANAEIQVKALRSALPDKDVPRIAYVFKIDIRGETFVTRDKARVLAGNFGFEEEIVTHEPGSTMYEWNNLVNKSTLKYNTSTDNFTFYKNESELPTAPNIELPNTLFKAPEFAKNYLSGLGVYTSEFVDGQSYPYPVVMRNGIPYSAESLDKAELLRIDFQKVTPLLIYPLVLESPFYEGEERIDFSTYVEPVSKLLPGTKRDAYYIQYARRVGQTPETSNVQLYMSSQMSKPAEGMYLLNFNNWKVEDTPCGTYPLRAPSSAITLISEGKGSVVSLIETGGDKLHPVATQAVKEINLYNMELVYYEANTVQKFLQPIYIATGEVTFENGAKGEVAIYVSAINYESFTPITE